MNMVTLVDKSGGNSWEEIEGRGEEISSADTQAVKINVNLEDFDP